MMFILMSLILVSHQELLLKEDQCTCKQILSSFDCNQLSNCDWNNETGFCEDRIYTDSDSYCSINSTNCPADGCALYKGICIPFSGCSVYQAKTHAECQKISRICTANGEHCIQMEWICDNYKSQFACEIDLDGYPCIWNKESNLCYQILKCNEIPQSYKTHQACFQAGQKNNLKCTAKQGGGCTEITEDCKNLQEVGCVIKQNGNSCFWNGSSCQDYICSNAPASNTTHKECQSFQSTCTVNNEQKGCMEIASNCDAYQNKSQCTYASEGLCVWSETICKDGDTNCESKQACKLWLCENASSTYNTDSLCRQFKNECTVNNTDNGCIKRLESCSQYQKQQQCISVLDDSQKCFWNGTQCVDKTCGNAILSKYNDGSCSRYMPQCTAGNNQCIHRTCNTYLTESLCSKDYQNNKCNWSGHCTKRTCENASDDLSTHSDCQQWLEGCTIKQDLKGCQNLADSCEAYKIEDQCRFAGTPKFQCLWINRSCVKKNCSYASLDIDNDEECLSYSRVCMISDKKSGCVNRKATCLELLQHQCSITSQGTLCFWNQSSSQCVIRQCTQGTSNSFQACQQFLPTCTVNHDGTQYRGCIAKSDKCSSYTNEYMCIDSLIEGLCIWNKKVLPYACEQRSCQNSDQTTSDEACNTFLSTCTVNADQTQCIQRKESCNLYLQELNCRKTKSGSQCIWLNNACTDKTCDKADKTYTSHQECQQFNKDCTTNGKGCILLDQCSKYTTRSGCVIDENNQLCAYQPSCNILQCSDAPYSYSTDEQCRTYKSECTTNGNGCVLRTQCSQAYIQQACVTDSKGSKCSWINNKCLDYTCSTAPVNYVTELECHMHQPGCTTKQYGGCIKKGRCEDAKVQEACTTDKDGNQCIFSKNVCRDISCSDMPYTNHYECAKFKPSCTSNGITCIPQSNCNKKIQSGCFMGSDGPCLWIKNTCYQYSSCTSLNFQTHQQCYEVSNECTTDGNNCIPLDRCANLNATSCFQGTDGKCVFITSNNKCQLYTGCNSLQYEEHQICYSLSNNCTTNGTKCIELSECSSYTQEKSCYLNRNHQKCYYDTQAKKCVDLQCSHLQFTTHQECNRELETCTSDNIKCIKIDKCETYQQHYCNLTPSLDGNCSYDLKEQKCRLIQCQELLENCSQISKCIDSGLGCVDYSTCDKYQTEKACKYGGSDGYCIWYLDNGKGKCKIMASCLDASSSIEACQSKAQTCQWTQTLSKSTCAQHTCSSKKQQSSYCQPIIDFSGKYYEICTISNGQCFSEKLSSLGASNCFSGTAYTYTWDSANSVCLKCGTVYNNKSNDDDDDNDIDNNFLPGEQMKSLVLFPMLCLIISIYI